MGGLLGWRISRQGDEKFCSVRIPGQRLALCSPVATARSPLPPGPSFPLRVACETKGDASEKIRRKGHESTEKSGLVPLYLQKMCSRI